jgi:hypothetical protein
VKRVDMREFEVGRGPAGERLRVFVERDQQGREQVSLVVWSADRREVLFEFKGLTADHVSAIRRALAKGLKQ